jgi:hypothetical protein
MIRNGEKKVLGVVLEYRLKYRVSVVALSSWVATHCLNGWGRPVLSEGTSPRAVSFSFR